MMTLQGVSKRLAAAMLLTLGAVAAHASTTTVNLTARTSTTTLPDGKSVPMWQFCGGLDNTQPSNAGTTSGGTCGSAWTPGPTIVVPSGTDLAISLTNNLKLPTSVVILGQLGGGLGNPKQITRLNSPDHAPQTSTTFPAAGTDQGTFTPPAQLARVQSFGTETAADPAKPGSYTWTKLKPGTYLYEAGTLPSLQVPMGLYGVLVVTDVPSSDSTFKPRVAYPATGTRAEIQYDSDATLLFSEIDPVQNTAVDAAANAGTVLTLRIDDPSCSTQGGTKACYPAAVNYSPRYFLINGKSYDATNPDLSTLALGSNPYASKQLLLRLANAGSRLHIPSIVGLPMSIIAEDGNVAPGNPKIQNEVGLQAGKTFDVIVTPPGDATNGYAAKTFSLFDRQGATSAGGLGGGGMQAFLAVNGASATNGGLPTAVTPTLVADSFKVPYNTSINGNVKLNDIAAAAVSVKSGSGPTQGVVALAADGSFIYTPNADASGTDAFTYVATNTGAQEATVTLTIVKLVGPPVANDDAFSSNVLTTFSTKGPGLLANDTDPSGLALSVDTTSLDSNTCGTVTLSGDGSFTVTDASGSPGGSCSFKYKVKNSQGTLSTTAAKATVNFAGAKSGLNVKVADAKSGTAITDYRWLVQEDLTFKTDPTATPALSTRTIGTSFHRSHMTVVASGCVGPKSCGSGQTVRGVDIAAGPESKLGNLALDPNKDYYISILPGDALDDPTVGGTPHLMAGIAIPRKSVAALGSSSEVFTIKAQASPINPAQLSVFIYEDNNPTNNQYDTGEQGLGGFNIILVDAVGRSGDVAGQQTYDMFGMPLSNALLGRPGCPDELNTHAATGDDGQNLVGVVYTCPSDPNAGTSLADSVKYALAGHALIKYLEPARYDVLAYPAAAREAGGERWWQVETLEGTAAQDAFVGTNEPKYFQEFGPPGFHTSIGFVNPDHVTQYGLTSGGVTPTSQPTDKTNPTFTISGLITNQHMSRPSDVTLWDAGTYDLLSATVCRVVLNSGGGDGPAVAITECDDKGNFKLNGIPNGSYEIQIFDRWLDQIIQAQAVTVSGADVKLGNADGHIPVFTWFTQFDQFLLLDDGTKNWFNNPVGIANALMTNRYRNGSISNQTLTDSAGNGLLPELFPLFNWYVSEADTTRFKQTRAHIVVDGGGKVDATGDFANLISTTDPEGKLTIREETPGAYSYGHQGFIGQRNTIFWGRAPYAEGENGGIQGTVVYSSTRPFDDQRYNVQNIWAPLVPRVVVNLYRKVTLADGSTSLQLVDSTKTTSFDDWVNTVVGSDSNLYIQSADGSMRSVIDGTLAPVGVTAGKQSNLQCPGQTDTDPFLQYTLALQNTTTGSVDKYRCYDGFHNWNQVQPAPYDGRYGFPSPAYIAAHPLPSAVCSATVTTNCKQPGQTLVSLPPGDYVVEAVTPPGYEIVKEEDKNIFTGDQFNSPQFSQFAGLGALFILPDQATLNNNNLYNAKTADKIRINATTNNGVNASMNQAMPECVGSLHRVPDYLTIFPGAGLAAPFAGMDRPLCDRKLVRLQDQQQFSANFFIFTPVPLAANGAGIILDDASAEFNAASPDFGEKASVPFVPVSVKDWSGTEISRVYADQWGAYNLMYPSSWTVNPPTPSGYLPNMLVNCMNDPGPTPERDASGKLTGRLITDPQYNAAYSNFCYTLPFMPGQTTYLDTPVLPVAAFAQGYNPADCEYPDSTPAIKSVSTSAGFGPYLPSKTAGTITINALGDRNVPNPAYAGPFATGGLPAQRTLPRHYGFGGTKGTVQIGGVNVPSNRITWTDQLITIALNSSTSTLANGQVVVTTADGKTSIDAITMTFDGGTTPKRVDLNGSNGAAYTTIQAAIDAATPGDLILVNEGTYNELVVMWKPVRLQGVGGASVIINAAKFPTSKLETWRPTINALFGVDINTGNNAPLAQVDALPGQEITGGVVLLEPSVLGTEEGAGITVLAKGFKADGVTPLQNIAADCAYGGNPTLDFTDVTSGILNKPKPGLSNFLCAASRIDGIGITGGDAGGGIYVNGWAHNLEIANNKVYGNAGAYNGGIRIGVPYLEQEALPTTTSGSGASARIDGFGFDNNVKIHHNYIAKNGTVEAPAGAGGAGGGVSICTGTDGYSVDHNWICGNYSSSDGGGIGHIGYSQGGTIAFNKIYFNETFQQTAATGGGGIAVVAEPALAGPLALGTGNLTIDANILRGNVAQGGRGGGLLLQGVNGQDVSLYPSTPARWFKATVTNNIIDNNVAGTAGAGISLSDTVNSVFVNNTVASNDSTGSSGEVITAGVGKPGPAGIASSLNSAALAVALQASTSITDKVVSGPQLLNNIVWHNRSFFYSPTGGGVDNKQQTLCASNDVSATGCTVLPEQAITGQCTGTAAFWDLGVFGDSNSGNPVAGARLYPTYSVLSSTAGYLNAVQTINHSIVAVTHSSGTVTVTLDSTAGFLVGQNVTIAGDLSGLPPQASVYNGTWQITFVGTVNVLGFQVPAIRFTDTNANLPLLAAGGTASVTVSVAANNSSGDPLLQEPYCNGSRVMPEFAAVINPPAMKSYQAAATVDEGNNFVNVKYGPLYLSQPVNGGTTFAPFGDYHLVNDTASSALNHGTTGVSTHDVDGQNRPQGGSWDIGADEVVAATNLAITKTDGVTTVKAGGTTTYTIAVTNRGNSTVASATMTDIRPSAITNWSWTCAVVDTGAPCTGSNVSGGTNTGPVSTNIVATLTNLAAGHTAVFTVVANISATAVNGATLTNTATITATGDAVTADNSATDVDTVIAPVITATTSLSPATFGNVGFGGTGTVTLTLANAATSSENLVLNGALAMGGTNQAQFSAAYGTGTTACTSGGTGLAPGASCTVVVTFTPTGTPGARSATLSIGSNATTAVPGVTLSGTLSGAVAAFSWTNGGSVGAWGTNSGTRTIVVTNSGNASLTAMTETVANVTGTQFTLASTTCGDTLATGGTCNVVVARNRPTTAPRSGTGILTIGGSGMAASTAGLNLSGN